LTLPAAATETATIEFRQAAPGDATQQITIMSVNYAETGTYTVKLPAGTYNVVATYTTSIITADSVATGGTTTLNFTL
jgi:hypothetical protein